MLRLFVVTLLLANVGYFAWIQGYLAVLGLAPAAQTEPARLQAQIRPEAMRLLSSNEARRIETAGAQPAKPPECLQSPLLPDSLAIAVRNAAQGLPAGSWALDPTNTPGRWIVYMGPYSSPDVLAKKKSELRGLGVSFEALQRASLEPGISLGGFDSQAEANQALASVSRRGVRTAKVTQEIAPSQGQTLRLPAVDDALRPQLEPIKTALDKLALRTCPA